MRVALHHWEPGPNSGEVLIALNELRIEFTSHYVDLLEFEQHTPAFLEMNPRGEVPVLVHDGHVLTETTLILEYLAAAFPGGDALVPASITDRYRMRVWTKLANESFAPALTVLGWQLRMRPKLWNTDFRLRATGVARLPRDRQDVWRLALDPTYAEDQLVRANQFLESAARRLDEALAQSEWLAGERYSLADIAIFPLAHALQWLLPDIANIASRPRLAQWLRRIRERPAVRGALAMARSARPEEMFAPGPELGRWG